MPSKKAPTGTKANNPKTKGKTRTLEDRVEELENRLERNDAISHKIGRDKAWMKQSVDEALEQMLDYQKRYLVQLRRLAAIGYIPSPID